MGKYFGLGECSKFYIYILLSAIFDVLKDILYGLNHNESFRYVKLYNSEIQNELSNHNIIHYFYNYIGIILLGHIFYKKEISNSKNEPPLISINNQDLPNSPIVLIHNIEEIEEDFKTEKAFYIFLSIIFLWVLEEHFIRIYMVILQDLDFWMIEILIISYLTIRMFKIKIFRHQMIAIAISIIPCILKIISIRLSFKDDTPIEHYNYTGKLPIFYVENSFYIIPLGIIIYIILICFRSFVNSSIKWYMDLKYISPNKLLMYYGSFGASICFLVSFISSFKECSSFSKNNYENNKNKPHFVEYICKVKKNETISNSMNTDINDINLIKFINFLDNETNNEIAFNNISYSEYNITYYYFESFLLYFQKFKDVEILKELSIILLGMILFFLDKFFSILVIKNLTPVHITFSIPIIYILQKLLMVINTIIFDNQYFRTNDYYKKKKYICDVLGDFFSVLGFLIYLEIIVIKIFNLDYNIKVNISRRSFGESYGINKKPINENENDNDEEKSFASEEVEQEEEDLNLVYS